MWRDRLAMLSEPYEMALPIAEELQDVNALRWICTGILGQAWTDDKLGLIERAKLQPKPPMFDCSVRSRVMEADAFVKDLEESFVRDAVVRVTWTGDCDVDLLVEEPSGTICSVNNPRTAAGGMLLRDGSPANKGPDGVCSETYVCRKASLASIEFWFGIVR